MSQRVPDPQETPDGPAYEGRLLARPEDEVVDQGAAFDARTLVSRRGVLSLVGLGAGAVVLAACTSTSSNGSGSTVATTTPTVDPTEDTLSGATTTGTTEGEIPEETNGPYPADGTNGVNVLEESGIVRSDVTTSLDTGTAVDGVPLTMTFTIQDMANGSIPFEGAALYMWQCDAAGLYSMYSEGAEDETYLRGVQVADADGNVTFQTIVPGCYAGRWTHIHFEVYPDVDSAISVENVIATSQLAFPPEMLADVYALDAYAGSTENLAGVGTQISDDGIFGDGDWSLQVPTVSGDVETGYIASLTVGVDTTTEPSAGGGMGNGGPGGGAPGGDGGPGGEMPPGDAPSGDGQPPQNDQS
jgi:protocatechuate 3,4-dioxygenase beta subunit